MAVKETMGKATKVTKDMMRENGIRKEKVGVEKEKAIKEGEKVIREKGGLFRVVIPL